MLTDFVIPIAELTLCIVIMVMVLMVVGCLRLLNAPHECCAKCGRAVSANKAVMSCGITYCPKCAAQLVDDEDGE